MPFWVVGVHSIIFLAAVQQQLGQDDAARRHQRRFADVLDRLRRELEREQGQSVMQELLRSIRVWAPHALREEELRDLHETIRLRLTDPLALYYRGVSRLWLGQTEEARHLLNDYLDRLPADAGDSHAHTLLAEAVVRRTPRAEQMAASVPGVDE